MTTGNFQIVQASEVQLDIPDFPATEFENLGTTVEVRKCRLQGAMQDEFPNRQANAELRILRSSPRVVR